MLFYLSMAMTVHSMSRSMNMNISYSYSVSLLAALGSRDKELAHAWSRRGMLWTTQSTTLCCNIVGKKCVLQPLQFKSQALLERPQPQTVIMFRQTQHFKINRNSGWLLAISFHLNYFLISKSKR